MRLVAVLRAFFAQRQALMHAESMLFIDDHQCELRECDAFLKQRVCADDQRGETLANPFEHGAARLAGLPPRQQRHGDPERLEPAPEILRMLIGEQFGRRHERDLPAHLHGLGCGQCGHQRLAATHIALYQAQHRLCRARGRARFHRARARCAWVGRNGSAASKPALSLPLVASGQPGLCCIRCRSSLSDSWCASSSSNARRRCAGCRRSSNRSTGASAGGRCTYCKASRSEGSRESARTEAGSQSSMSLAAV